ncbi:hypothetical protein niasHS_015704 [Heterodera schachtii]|uniref:Uncharacterized protein n=1 Tax=Heterodera schachtii TaxID=97005 RepID=A0ABD2HNW4_HETSC
MFVLVLCTTCDAVNELDEQVQQAHAFEEPQEQISELDKLHNQLEQVEQKNHWPNSDYEKEVSLFCWPFHFHFPRFIFPNGSVNVFLCLCSLKIVSHPSSFIHNLFIRPSMITFFCPFLLPME